MVRTVTISILQTTNLERLGPIEQLGRTSTFIHSRSTKHKITTLNCINPIKSLSSYIHQPKFYGGKVEESEQKIMKSSVQSVMNVLRSRETNQFS